MTPPSPGSACEATTTPSRPAGSSMRVLLRDCQSGLLYAGTDRWSSDWSEAIPFENVTAAIDCASSAGLASAEVIMRFLDPPFEIPLKLFSSRKALPG